MANPFRPKKPSKPSYLRKHPKTHKPSEAAEAFIMTRLVMLDSVARQALTPLERTLLEIIEIEHMRHGGVENGRLVVTRRQFEKRGIPRNAIAPALRALAALGFIEITERGAAGVGDLARTHRFRLTYVQPNPTDEWRKHHDPKMTRVVAETARKSADIRARRLGLRSAKKQIAGPEKLTGLVRKPRPGTPAAPGEAPGEAHKTAGAGPEKLTGNRHPPVRKPRPLSIFRRVEGSRLSSQRPAPDETRPPSDRPNGSAAPTPADPPGPASIHALRPAPAASLPGRLAEARGASSKASEEKPP